MHFTRRHPDRTQAPILGLIALLVSGGTAAACSSSDDIGDVHVSDIVDAAADAPSAPVEAGSAPSDAGDGGAIDAGPLPIVCSTPPCAIALTTTLGATVDDRSEGFCALLDDGTVACWGANGAGQLGRGADAGIVDSSDAKRVLNLSDVASIDHTCAVTKAGDVWCWGTGPFLQQANGAAITTERTPVKLDVPPSTAVGVGYATACAAVEGGIQCWGSNTNAQLGPLPAPSGDTGRPRAVEIPAGAPVRTIAVGTATLALREDATLVTWGANPPIGRLSSVFPEPSPGRVAIDGFSSVELAHDNACATAAGIGYCWGAPAIPGKGSPLDRALPEPVVTPEPIVDIATTQTHVITGLGLKRSRWCAVSISGAVFCWGLNESGQAGDGTQDYAFDSVRVADLPEPAARVKTTPNATCALLTNGKIYCWGSNYNGQLGNGKGPQRSFVPVEVQLP